MYIHILIITYYIHILDYIFTVRLLYQMPLYNLFHIVWKWMISGSFDVIRIAMSIFLYNLLFQIKKGDSGK